MEGFSIETGSLLQVDRSVPHPQEVQLKFNVFPDSLLKGRGVAAQAWFLMLLECRENALIPGSTQQDRWIPSELLCIMGWTGSPLF